MTDALTWETDDQQRLVLLRIPPDDKPRIVRICCASRNGEIAVERFDQFLKDRKSSRC